MKRYILLAALTVPIFGAGAVTQGTTADVLTFHRDPQRTGWDRNEMELTPESVASSHFGQLWQSPQLDRVDGKAPRLYASPLYVDKVELSSGLYKGGVFRVVFVASSNGFVYAINAFPAGSVAPGTILWRTELAHPGGETDGQIFGVLSTPVIDLNRGRMYVTTCSAGWNWLVYALDITTGRVLLRWPVEIDLASLTAVDRNAGPADTNIPPRLLKRPSLGRQRGALNLSPRGDRLYLTFGESLTGWVAAVDTNHPRVDTAFASVASQRRSSGGIWGAGGPAVDAQGNIYVGTGTDFGGLMVQPHDWTQSVLKLSDSVRKGFTLTGTYTPFNYGVTAAADVDLGSGGVCIIPNLDPGRTTTPSLLAIGGKQGNVYLVDRDRMPGRLDRRPDVTDDSRQDGSLIAPTPQMQFHRPGPLNVFGPYTETAAAVDQARGRSVPAFFRGEDGASYLFVTGSSKNPADLYANVPPCLARLKIATSPGQHAYLEIDLLEKTLTFDNPGSPIITSNGAKAAIVWVLDENAYRTASLDGSSSPRPRLYAIDAQTLKPLWISRPNELFTSGKYNEPTVARGIVFVGTDRIQAFGLRKTDENGVALASPGPPELEMKMTPLAYGKSLYNTGGACATCHQPDGRGVPNSFPPLAGSDWVNGPDERLIRAVLYGLEGPIQVAGTTYNASAMPAIGQVAGSPFSWSDEKIADVLTYIRQEWGNHASRVSAEKVSKIRREVGDHKAWTQGELIGVHETGGPH